MYIRGEIELNSTWNCEYFVKSTNVVAAQTQTNTLIQCPSQHASSEWVDGALRNISSADTNVHNGMCQKKGIGNTNTISTVSIICAKLSWYFYSSVEIFFVQHLFH